MHNHRISGITLIELMIAMLLGTFLMLSGYQLLENQIVFMKNALGSAEDEDLIIFTEKVLSKNIENAGYFGCQNMNHAIVSSTLSDYLPPPPIISASESNNGSDILVIRAEDANTTYLTKKMASPKTILYLANNNFNPGDIAVIGDCEKSDIFKVGSIHNLQINHTPFSQAYDVNASVGSFKTSTFYIGKTNYTNEKNSSALFYQALDDHAQDLIPGITQFNVFFNTAEDPTHYLKTSEIQDWSKIKSIKFNITFLNHQNKPQSFSFFVSLRNA